MTTEEKIDSILLLITEQGKDIAVIKQRLKDIDEHKVKIESLEKNQNKVIGALVVVGAAFSAAMSWVVKHF